MKLQANHKAVIRLIGEDRSPYTGVAPRARGARTMCLENLKSSGFIADRHTPFTSLPPFVLTDAGRAEFEKLTRK